MILGSQQTSARRLLKCSVVAALAAATAACAAFPRLEAETGPAFTPTGALSQQAAENGGTVLGPSTSQFSIPGRTSRTDAGPGELTADDIARLTTADPVSVTLPAQPIPQFLAVVFGEVLNVPYSLGPGVAARTDSVALRSGPVSSQADFLRLIQVTLREYGIRLQAQGGSILVVDDGVASGGAPQVIRSRETADRPRAAQPVVQFFDVQTYEANSLMALMRDLGPSLGNVRIQAESLSNSLILTGSARDVMRAVETLREIDQPRFAGSQVLRVKPVYYSADGLAEALERTLTAEGYAVSRIASARRSITILSLPTANQVLIFTTSEDLLARVSEWVSELDRPATFGDTAGTFVYQVQNTDAQSLGALTTGAPQSASRTPQTPVGVPGATPEGAAQANTTGATGAGSLQRGQGQFLNGRVIVDPMGNRILFTGTANEFAQLRMLLETLDVPARQVLVEVMIAEVTLTDETRVGLEWFFNQSMSDGVLEGGTEGGLGLEAAGLNLDFTGMDLRAAFNAFASNNRVNVLSRPRLVARSGSEARIQVGTDVPIITSQRAANSQSGGDTDILQTVQYRQTGVILNIRPVVYGDGRIDLEISQEVSSQQNNAGSSIASPLILNRSVSTQLSLADGATAVLGGLIDNSYSKGNAGVPFLKDLPVLGNVFRSDVISGNRTEIVLLVTPYVLRNTEDMDYFASQYLADINDAFRVGRGWAYTLTPLSTGVNVGVGVPEANSPSLRNRPAPQVSGEPDEPVAEDPAE